MERPTVRGGRAPGRDPPGDHHGSVAAADVAQPVLDRRAKAEGSGSPDGGVVQDQRRRVEGLDARRRRLGEVRRRRLGTE
eukprot:31422-Pelagococcus_subviridis.AAC.6